jgi:hypothetical protein
METSNNKLPFLTNLINCLLNRASKICSSKKLLNEEISKIKKILNSYQSKLICDKIMDFLKKMEPTKTPTEHPDPMAQAKRLVYLALPYYNDADDLKKKITDGRYYSFSLLTIFIDEFG